MLKCLRLDVDTIKKKVQVLTNPSMHDDSLIAPQHPRKPTTIIRAPAAIRMYTPAEEEQLR